MKYAFIRQQDNNRDEIIYDDLKETVFDAWNTWEHLTRSERNKQQEFCVAYDFKLDDDCPGCISNDGYNVMIDFLKTYMVKPDFIDKWFIDARYQVNVFTAVEVLELAQEWETPVDKIMQQLIEI